MKIGIVNRNRKNSVLNKNQKILEKPKINKFNSHYNSINKNNKNNDLEQNEIKRKSKNINNIDI